MAKVIICPYCCEKFWPNQVDFRLNRPLESESGGEGQAEQDDALGLGGRPVRPRRPGAGGGLIIDSKLKAYYMEYLGQDEETAVSNAVRLPAISVNYEDPRLRYDELFYQKNRYVLEVEYEGQKLTQRLCPHCHNNVLEGAGKYETKLISIVGDTNAGKTVYLTVLFELLSMDTHFQGVFDFIGDSAEREKYRENYNLLIRGGEVMDSTVRTRIPPMPFLYTYRYIDDGGQPRDNKVIIIVYDIAGEDCRDPETMKAHGYNIRYSSGLLFLIDPTTFDGVRLMVDADSDIDSHYVREIFAAMNKYFVAGSEEDKMVIPTAVVLSKGDKLKELPYFQEESRRAVVTHPDWRGIHRGCIEKQEIQELDAQVRAFLQAVGEQAILNSCRGILAQASFFLMSALGKAPVITQLDPLTRSVQIEGGLNPYRVTEPFYWLLMKNDLICCHEQETFQDRKKQTKNFDIWYYDDESPESLEMRKKQIRAELGGKTGFLARFFGER